uniref:Uncharacterized protein n=1 Tax=Romanomermis culicivorax TaxID=13658 RepID=A0A915KGQ1_ROMCU
MGRRAAPQKLQHTSEAVPRGAGRRCFLISIEQPAPRGTAQYRAVNISTYIHCNEKFPNNRPSADYLTKHRTMADGRKTQQSADASTLISLIMQKIMSFFESQPKRMHVEELTMPNKPAKADELLKINNSLPFSILQEMGHIVETRHIGPKWLLDPIFLDISKFLGAQAPKITKKACRQNIIEVSNWYFAIRSDKRLNYENRNFFVCVEGQKPGDASTYIRSHILEPVPPCNGILRAKNGRYYKANKPKNSYEGRKVSRGSIPSNFLVQLHSPSDKTDSQTTDDTATNNDVRYVFRRDGEVRNCVQDAEIQTDILSPIVNIKNNDRNNGLLSSVNAKNTSTPLKRVYGVIDPASKHFDLYLRLVRDIKPTSKRKWGELFEIFDRQTSPKIPFFATPLPIVEPPKKNSNISNGGYANNEKMLLRKLPKVDYAVDVNRSLRVECERIEAKKHEENLHRHVTKKKTIVDQKKQSAPTEVVLQHAPPPKKLAKGAEKKKHIEPPKLVDELKNDVPDFFKSLPDQAQLKLISMPFRDDFSLATTPGSLAGQSRIFSRRSETDISAENCTTNDIFCPAASQPKKNVEQYVRQIQRSKPKRKVAEQKSKNMVLHQKQPGLKRKQVKSKMKKLNDMFQEREKKLDRLRAAIDSDEENHDENPAPLFTINFILCQELVKIFRNFAKFKLKTY